MMHNKDAETPCHGLFLIYRFRMAKKGKKKGIFFYTYVWKHRCLLIVIEWKNMRVLHCGDFFGSFFSEFFWKLKTDCKIT